MLLTRLKAKIASVLIPPGRAVVRYALIPIGAGSATLSILRRLAWRAHPFVVRTRVGFRFAGDTRNLLARFVYYFGVWEPTITDWMRSLPLRGRTVIDIGANLGWHSLLAAACVGLEGRVVAIEASQTIFESLRRNVSLNGARNIRLVNAAVWNEVKDLPLFLGDEDNIGTTTLVRGAVTSTTPGEVVHAAPLGDLIDPHEVASTGLVKIDVEGAEAQVIAGLRPLIARFPRDVRFVVEIKPTLLSGTSADDLLAIFRAEGFRAYVIENAYTAEFYVRALTGAIPYPISPVESVTRQVDVILTRQESDVASGLA